MSLFKNIELNEEGQALVQQLRDNFESFSQFIMSAMEQPTRESSLALTKLEECSMFAIKAVCQLEKYQSDIGPAEEPTLEEKLKV